MKGERQDVAKSIIVTTRMLNEEAERLFWEMR